MKPTATAELFYTKPVSKTASPASPPTGAMSHALPYCKDQNAGGDLLEAAGELRRVSQLEYHEVSASSLPARGLIVGQSPQMLGVFELIRRAATSEVPVLILGEPGTGKDLVARAIHANGPRRDKPFFTIDCPAFPPTLTEIELFGDNYGSAKEEVVDKIGLLGSARQGTLYLDEITDLPLGLQVRILRVIERREFRALGSTTPLPFSSRILAATSRDLQSAVGEGQICTALYYRLNVLPIVLPPLRERKMDIPLISDHILRMLHENSSDNGVCKVPVLSRDAIDVLMAHKWPGNVRELENCLARALASECGPVICAKDLSLESELSLSKLKRHDSDDIVPLKELERSAILHAITAAGGDKALAARLLGIGKNTLYRKLNRYHRSQ